jgi:acyl-CoA synthetase (AMP-forming)/AMP-acid ligase II
LTAALGAAAKDESGLIFVDSNERELQLSWNEVHRRARRVAASLHRVGLKRGDRVALILRTGPEFTDSFFGCLLAGTIPVPLYPPLRLGRLNEYHSATARMLTLVGARLVVSDSQIRRLLGRSIEASRPELGCVTSESLLSSTEELEAEPYRLALIQFSSGSTVDPKPVTLSQSNVLAQCAIMNSIIRASAGARELGVSWLPLYHDMGLIGCLLNAVYYPASLVLIPPENFLSRPALWLRAISRHRGTASAAPNFGYSLCQHRIKEEDLEGVDLSCWRIALNGSEPVSTKVLNAFAGRFQRWGFNPRALTPGYGLAEATLAVTYSAPEREVRALAVDPAELARSGTVQSGSFDIASVGPPVAGVSVQVRDEDGRELPDRRVGRIFVRGPSVMEGYFEQPEATAQALVEGWLDTGDLGFVDDGELYVSGRAKDVVIIRGANHQPQEFENCLEGIPGVRTGCAVALGFTPTTGTGEELLLLVETSGDTPGDLTGNIRRAVLDGTGVKPHTIQLLKPGTLPRTSSGKMRRSEALRRFLSGELSPPQPVNAVRLAGKLLESALAFARTRAGP